LFYVSRKEVTWSSLHTWHQSLSEKEQAALGVQNIDENPPSAYNYDSVSKSLGPGASIQRAFQDAGSAVRRAFGYGAVNNTPSVAAAGNSGGANDGVATDDDKSQLDSAAA
jgi:hypothetical protein